MGNKPTHMETTALTNGSKDAINKFCRTLRVSPETVEELVSRRLLHFNGETWRLGDANNGSSRKFYGKWKRADNAGHDWHKLIGLDDVILADRRRIIFTLEGSKDAIAAAELAHRNGVLPQTGIICALGSGYRPIKSEIDQLRGRSVLLIGDNDAAGVETVELASRALAAVGVDHKMFDWTNRPEKDLHDFLSAASQDSFFSNFSSSLSLLLTIQPFNTSTLQLHKVERVFSPLASPISWLHSSSRKREQATASRSTWRAASFQQTQTCLCPT
jgi:hypothetical protein